MFVKGLKKFAGDKRGNFALLTAITFPMLISGAVLAADISNNLRARSDLQNANDAAVLYAARNFQDKKAWPTAAELKKFIQGNITEGRETVTTSVVFDNDRMNVTLNSKVKFKPMLMNYFGAGDFELKSVSKAEVGVANVVEFALALDTTASMQYEGRMTGLKVAAKDFIKSMMDQKDRGANVRGGIVPFALYVNVGTSRRNESWLQVPANIDTRVYGQKTNTVQGPLTGGQTCTNVAGYWTNAQPARINWVDGVGTPVAAVPSSWVAPRQNCVLNRGPSTTVTLQNQLLSGSLTVWNGCVSSRSNPLNISDPYAGNKFPGILGTTCADELLPLTSSRSSLNSKIDAFPIVPLSQIPNMPTGVKSTYMPDGVMWGMRLLTNSAPFTEGLSTGGTAELRKSLILMTDGQNTVQPRVNGLAANMVFNRVDHANSPSTNGVVNSTVPDALTLEACTAAKVAGIEVYTIGFGSSITPAIRTMLTQCASKTSMYFDAADSNGLSIAFGKISTSLLTVRLVQ